MKKCGIVTITVGSNYGNKLQNYALQQIVLRLGFQTETIRFRPTYPVHDFSRNPIKTKLQEWKTVGLVAALYDLHRIFKKRIYETLFINSKISRDEYFAKFAKTYINMSIEEFTPTDDLGALNKQYDVFIAGSDQIWNPYWEGINPFYFLHFADEEKRITYAPSFGVSDIPEELIEYYLTLLSGIPHLSIREEQGQKIIRSLINRVVPILPDPTFLLSSKEWLEVAKKPERLPQKDYLLTYFLGKKSYEYHKQITKYAKENRLQLVSLNDISNPYLYSVGPAEFLDLIANAKLVCTDSFHGCVFSIVFGRPFVVFERGSSIESESMNSRIETLLKSLNLQERRYFQMYNSENWSELDFSDVHLIVQRKRKEALDYLNTVLNGKNP